jgi:hypothetical protein
MERVCDCTGQYACIVTNDEFQAKLRVFKNIAMFVSFFMFLIFC